MHNNSLCNANMLMGIMKTKGGGIGGKSPEGAESVGSLNTFMDKTFLSKYAKLIDTCATTNNSDTNSYFTQLCKCLCYNILIKPTFTQKLAEFNLTIHNIFMSKECIDHFCDVYSRVCRTESAIRRLAFLYKWRKTPVYNTEDLCLNPVYDGQKNTMTLLKNGRKYVFTLRELITNLNRELSNTASMFSDPIPCKNPYTNILFGKADLYNIYFAIRSSTYIMPTLLHEYFMVEFDITRFMNEKDIIIQEHYIDNYVSNVTTCNVATEVRNMLELHCIHSIHVSKDFPKSVLLEIMTPYLRLHYVSQLTSNQWKKANAFLDLHNMLHDFVRQSPGFGREQARLHGGGLCSTATKYNQTVPKIKRESVDKYMNSHSKLNHVNDAHIMMTYDVIVRELRVHRNRMRRMNVEGTYGSPNTPSLFSHYSPQREREPDDVDDDSEMSVTEDEEEQQEQEEQEQQEQQQIIVDVMDIEPEVDDATEDSDTESESDIDE